MELGVCLIQAFNSLLERDFLAGGHSWDGRQLGVAGLLGLSLMLLTFPSRVQNHCCSTGCCHQASHLSFKQKEGAATNNLPELRLCLFAQM